MDAKDATIKMEMDPQLSHEHSAKEPNTYLSSPQGESKVDANYAVRLMWQLCHLCNVTTSSISSWLSLESLARHTGTYGTLSQPLFAYQPLLLAHAHMLQDLATNLQVVRDALLPTALHRDCVRDATYRSLVDAAQGIPAVVRLIPTGSEECMPSLETRKQIRKACDEVTELCTGDEGKGIKGWKECLGAVKGFVEPES